MNASRPLLLLTYCHHHPPSLYHLPIVLSLLYIPFSLVLFSFAPSTPVYGPMPRKRLRSKYCTLANSFFPLPRHRMPVSVLPCPFHLPILPGFNFVTISSHGHFYLFRHTRSLAFPSSVNSNAVLSSAESSLYDVLVEMYYLYTQNLPTIQS